MGYYGINSFYEAEYMYRNIKPLRGKRASQDIRPLGTGSDRRYSWNRIVKINDNKYALTDGNNIYFAGDKDSIADTSPIVWERKLDNDNRLNVYTLTIRNNWNHGSAISRYKFLQRWLPRDMSFTYSKSGKHYIVYKGKMHYLPKPVIDVDWNQKTYEFKHDYKVVFKGYYELERQNGLMPFQTRRLDKKLNSKYMPLVEKLWEYMNIMLPVLGDLDSEKFDAYARILAKDVHVSKYYWTSSVKSETVREALENEESERRVALGVMCAYHVGVYEKNKFDPKDIHLQKIKELVRKLGKLYAVEYK
jgi:hypothetical protein